MMNPIFCAGPSGSPDDPLYYFVHIPKTAGTTMRKVVSAFFLPQQVFPPEITLYDGPDAELAYSLPYDSLGNYDLIYGHHAAEWLQPFLERCSRPFFRFAVLRDPLFQLYSEYRMALSDPAYPLHAEWKERMLTFDQFLTEPRLAWIAGKDRQAYHLMRQLVPSNEALPAKDEWYDRVTEMLASFAFVGVQEQLVRTVQVMCYVAGWPCPPRIPCVNRSAMQVDEVEIREQYEDRIVQENPIDVHLHRWARRSLEATFQEMCASLQIDNEDDPRIVEQLRARALAMRTPPEVGAHRAFRLFESRGFGLCHLNRQMGRQLQCIGPAPEATLLFQIYRPVRRFSIECLAWYDQSCLDNLRVLANGCDVPLHLYRTDLKCLFTGELPDSSGRAGPDSLELRITTSTPATDTADFIAIAGIYLH